MSQRLEKYLAIRNRIIGDFKHHCTEIEKYTTETNIAVIQLRDVAFEKTFKEFNDIMVELEKIQAYHETDGMANVLKLNRETQDKYLDIKARLSELLPGNTLLNSTLYPTGENSFAEPKTDNQAQTGMKLPPIQLKLFDGKFDEWTAFKDLFLAIMKRHKGDDVEKLSHLKNHLRGEALDHINHVALKNGNYEIAMDLLSSHFENRSAILDSYLQTFRNIPPILHTSPSSIRYAITTTQGCLASIKALDFMVDAWDPIIVFDLKNKLDHQLRDRWEEERKGSHTPATLAEFLKFLNIRQRVIISMPPAKQKSSTPVLRPVKTFVNQNEVNEKLLSDELGAISLPNENHPIIETVDSTENDPMIMLARREEQCLICGHKHRVFLCPKLTQDAQKALELVKEKKLCTNCLYNHELSECKSKGSCRICGIRHHTLLHDALHNTRLNINYVTQPKQTLLATAIVPVYCNGLRTYLRALIDQGSMIDLITENGAQLLNCPRENIDISLFGVSNTPLEIIKHKTTITIGSLHDKDFSIQMDVLISKHITSLPLIPKESFSNWTHLKDLQLADPNNFPHDKIDLLIGATTFAKILIDGIIKGNENEPIAQNTRLGWIISGSYSHTTRLQLNFVTNKKLADQMKMFWEIEEIEPILHQSPEDKFCEDYFKKTTTRCSDGKLMVRLPFKHDSTATDFLGYSYGNAKNRFLHLEKKFAINNKLKEDYTRCVEEYIDLGHAVKTKNICHVIPHHAVIKETSSTTKLRTVFDASAKTTNGYSLNERMHVGPILLEDIWSILLRWRLGKIAVTSDIEKMYRQFWVHPDDSKFQQILWRSSFDMPIGIYELKTVTFGTSAAPYLAIRCLHFIADHIKTKHSQVASIIKNNFYVDDLLASFDNITEAQQNKQILIDAFESFGLKLHKWNSNDTALTEQTTSKNIQLKLNTTDNCSTLGMRWDTLNDFLHYNITQSPPGDTYTKRLILSEIASLFDPLGILAPIIIRAKCLMQSLWLTTSGWDDQVYVNILEDWLKIRNDLKICGKITFNRWIGFNNENKHISIHGFADASEKAYAAVVFIRTEHLNGNIHVKLLTSKTKVAPLKSISIPRLELCAATLTAKLLVKITVALKITINEIFAWSDSSITLAWISTPPYKLKTFVANRVAQIQELLPTENWRYIKTKSNPADLASRGSSIETLVENELWWCGPGFLKSDFNDWPQIPLDMLPTGNLPELKSQKQSIHYQESKIFEEFVSRFSSYRSLLRITAICIRWLPKYKQNRNKVILASELITARNTLLRYIQTQSYGWEIDKLKNRKSLGHRNPLLSLTPFVDEEGILRVGGRLNNSCLSNESKHPAIIPSKAYLTKLIIRQAHFRIAHGGTQLTLRTIRDEFWIIRGKTIVKNELRKCITCFRTRCKPMQQRMSDLLSPQVQPNRPFSFTGVDFAGYFLVKSSTLRNAPYQKCYVSLFICLTTKAIHLELVHNLTTEAFIASLGRFIARRGIPNHIYSDQGSNFIGAANELPNVWYHEKSKEHDQLQREYSNKGITWHFTPGRASHFGGLWEAGVKSMKTHLHRCFSNAKLTFEEFNTVIIQIEACLNSRPICPINDDPDDIFVLTPGHFLIGQALTTAPHPDVLHIPMNRLSRYQLLQRIVQDFWKNWSGEYLARLQQRPKWKQQHNNLRIGQLVLILDENIPPAQWNLGRILRIFPGKDKLVRCAELMKIENGRKITITRPIHKLCLLPIEDNLNDNEKQIYTNIIL